MSETPNALIDAAEMVFARDGFERASLREIMRIADANPASVHYHFGGKDGLLERVLDRAVEPITRGRLDALRQLRSSQPDGPLALRTLVEAFLRPDIDAIAALQARGPGRAGLVGRAYGQPTEFVRTIMYRQFDPVGHAYFPEFFASLPGHDQDVIRWRLRWATVGVIVALFSNADDPDGPIDDPGRALARAVDFVAAGLEAPTG